MCGSSSRKSDHPTPSTGPSGHEKTSTKKCNYLLQVSGESKWCRIPNDLAGSNVLSGFQSPQWHTFIQIMKIVHQMQREAWDWKKPQCKININLRNNFKWGKNLATKLGPLYGQLLVTLQRKDFYAEYQEENNRIWNVLPLQDITYFWTEHKSNEGMLKTANQSRQLMHYCITLRKDK